MSDGTRTRVRGRLARAGRRVAEAIDTDPLAAVEILTDADGVSHVYADDREALAYANGYVQADDRLFEMDVLRHVGYGDSAAVLGPSQLASDVQVRRTLYTEAELREQYETADEEVRAALRAFANGVNRRLVELVTTGAIPAEFVALGHVPEPWSPLDSVAVLAFMLGFFGVFGGDELDNATRLAKLTETMASEAEAFRAYGDLNRAAAAEEHLPTVPPADLTAADTPVAAESVPDYEAVPDEQLALARMAADAEPWGIERDVSVSSRPLSDRVPTGLLAGLQWGSNALAVAGDLTETGRPMLFGGPQMGYFKPPVIHEIGLHGAGFETVGVGVVGTPSVVIGRTDAFAWTVTSGYDDQVDVVAVELHPEDRHRYRTAPDERWRTMDTERGGQSTSLLGALADDEPDTSVRVLEQAVARVDLAGERCPVVAWHPDERVAWVERTTTRGDELAGGFTWAELGRADDRESFVETLSDFPFSFNFLYADAEDIAYVHTGRLPERNPDLDPRLPAPADAHEWRETRDGTGLGIVETAPSRGYFVQWNNAPVAGWRAGDEEGRWGRRHRVDLLDRIVREQLGADGDAAGGTVRDESDRRLSVADVEAVIEAAATYDPNAGATAPRMAAVAADSDDKRLRWMADELDAWAEAGYPWRDEQRIEVYDDPGHAVWDETRRALQDEVFRPRLEELTPELQFDPPTDVDPDGDEDPHAGDHGRTDREVALDRILRGDAAGDWVDDPDAAVRRALGRAADRLEDRFGTSYPGSWRLPAHRTEFRVLGAATKEAIEMVNRGSYNFVVALGPAGEPATAAESILPPANSGHLPLSALVSTLRGTEPAHLHDQLDRYVEFAYKPMALSRAAVERRAVREKRLWFRPGRPVGVGSGLRDTLLGAGLSLAADL